MSLAVDDGGQAFPVAESDPVLGSRVHFAMSLRDWFAGKAMTAAYASWMADCRDVNTSSAHMAQECYLIADAMIAEKRRTEGGEA